MLGRIDQASITVDLVARDGRVVGSGRASPVSQKWADAMTAQAFQKLLSGTESLVLYGLTEREGDRCYIAATLVGADGVRANYRKTHLWWKDQGLRHEPSW